jgi:hyaluronoglucosaminidase
MVDRDTLLLPRPWKVVARADAPLTPFGGLGSGVSLTGGDASDQAQIQRIQAERDPTGEGPEPFTVPITVVVHPEGEWPAVAQACAPDLPSVDEAHYLRLRMADEGVGNQIHLFAPGESGRRMAWQTIRQILLGTPVPKGDFAIADTPSSGMRGVIETFYGPSWEREDRLALMPMFAAMKFNTYIYASKMDLFTNWLFDYWKDGWDADHLAELAELAAAARDAGLLVGIQVRPLAAVTFSSEEDKDLFVGRVGELVDLGFDLFSLSFDDTDRVLVPEDQAVFDSYDEAVAAFAADVLARLHEAHPELVLGFVPNDYWSEAPTAESTLTELGEVLPDCVTIGWTGAQIIPANITADDAKLVAGWMQRKPLLGDNYPVLDHAGADLFLGPLQGREPDLPPELAGLLFNPMPYPFASLPGLATCADYAWNAAAYDPEQSRTAMATFLAGPGPAADALSLMADTNRSPTIGGSSAPGLEAAIAAFWEAFDERNGLDAAAETLVNGFLTPFARIPDDWASVRTQPLRTEVAPWTAQLGRCGAAAVTVVDLLTAQAAGQAIEPDELSSWVSALDEVRAYTPRPTAGVIQGFLDRAEQELVPVR